MSNYRGKISAAWRGLSRNGQRHKEQLEIQTALFELTCVFVFSDPISEQQLQRELNLPGAVVAVL